MTSYLRKTEDTPHAKISDCTAIGKAKGFLDDDVRLVSLDIEHIASTKLPL